MNLTPEQQELLSAYFDNEVNLAERALAEALLQRPEARAYLAGLAEYQALVNRHARVSVPADFAAGVARALEGDFTDVSRPTSEHASSVRAQAGDFADVSRPVSAQRGRLLAMPQAKVSWFTPVGAAAAALVVAAGLFFASSLNQPPAPTAPIAKHRETDGGDHAKAPDASEESTAEHSKLATHLELLEETRKRMTRANDTPAPSPANDPKPTRPPVDTRGIGDDNHNNLPNPADVPPTGRPEDSANDPAKDNHSGDGGKKSGDRTVPEIGSGGTEQKEPNSATKSKEGEKDAKFSATDARRREQDSLRRDRLDFAQDETVYTIVVDRDGKPDATAMYTELLKVSNKYGSATLRDGEPDDKQLDVDEDANDFTQYDGIEIEVPEDKVNELLAAIDALSTENEYGELVLPGAVRDEIEDQAARDRNEEKRNNDRWGPSKSGLGPQGGAVRPNLPEKARALAEKKKQHDKPVEGENPTAPVEPPAPPPSPVHGAKPAADPPKPRLKNPATPDNEVPGTDQPKADNQPDSGVGNKGESRPSPRKVRLVIRLR